MATEKTTNIHSGHRERMRNKFLAQEGENFPEHELLELLLYYAIPRVDTNEIAINMIEQFGSFSALLEAHPKEISRVCGVKESTAILIALQRTISKRYIQSKWEKKHRFANINMLCNYCSDALLYKDREYFLVICLDIQKRLLHTEIISEGDIISAKISPRKIVEIAMRYQAVSLVFSHNHPNGKAKPSKADINFTSKLISVLEPLNITVSDHIVVAADGGTFSFFENDLLYTENKNNKEL